jgi:hypothetical protein
LFPLPQVGINIPWGTYPFQPLLAYQFPFSVKKVNRKKSAAGSPAKLKFEEISAKDKRMAEQADNAKSIGNAGNKCGRGVRNCERAEQTVRYFAWDLLNHPVYRTVRTVV